MILDILKKQLMKKKYLVLQEVKNEVEKSYKYSDFIK